MTVIYESEWSRVVHGDARDVLAAESTESADLVVLDPCAGSGSTGVAAVLRGRRCLLVESHAPYARLAADRVREAEKVAAAGMVL